MLTVSDSPRSLTRTLARSFQLHNLASEGDAEVRQESRDAEESMVVESGRRPRIDAQEEAHSTEADHLKGVADSTETGQLLSFGGLQETAPINPAPPHSSPEFNFSTSLSSFREVSNGSLSFPLCSLLMRISVSPSYHSLLSRRAPSFASSCRLDLLRRECSACLDTVQMRRNLVSVADDDIQTLSSANSPSYVR